MRYNIQKIKIRYSGRISGRQYSSIKGRGLSIAAKNIELIADENNRGSYIIEVEKNTTGFGKEQLKCVFDESDIEVDYFLNLLCFKGGSILRDIKCDGYLCEGNFVPYNQAMEIDLHDRVIAHGFSIATTETTEKLVRSMDDEQNFEEIKRVNFVLAISDSVSKFISLYNMISNKCGDRQDAIDVELLKIDSTLGQVKSPYTQKYETIFTKLRNELAHKRDGANIINTHREIEENINRFECIALKIILNR